MLMPKHTSIIFAALSVGWFGGRKFQVRTTIGSSTYPAPQLCALDTPSKIIEYSSLIKCGMICIQESSAKCYHFNVRINPVGAIKTDGSNESVTMTCELYFFVPFQYTPMCLCLHYEVW